MIFLQIGARMLKTVIALSFSLWIAQTAGFSSPIFAAISCFLTLKPTILQSWKNVWLQIFANAVGAGCAVVFVIYIGVSPLYAGFAVLLLLLLHKAFKHADSLSLSIVTLLSIMEFEEGNFILFALERFSTTMIGVLVACLVNATILPPKYEYRLLQRLHSCIQSSRLLFQDAFSHYLVIPTRKTFTLSLQKDISDLGDMFHNYKEEFSPSRSLPIHPYQKRGYKSQKRLIIFQSWIQLYQIKQHTYDILIHQSQTISQWTQEEQTTLNQFINELNECEEWLLLLFEQKTTSPPVLPDPSTLPHYLLKDHSLSIIFGTIWEWHTQLSLLSQYIQNENDQS